MVTMELSGTARAALDVVLGQQQGRLADLAAFAAIRERLRLTEEERRTIASPDGRVVDEKAIERLEPRHLEIEDDHARRLKFLLQNWDGFRTGDVAWIGKLLEQLQRV